MDISAIRGRVGLFLAAVLAVGSPVLGAGPAQARADHDTVVHTTGGLVRGESTEAGRQFLGITYAEPPVGRLRWKEPQPVKPWLGVLDATEFGNRCVQGASWDPGYERPSLTENCLDLNVYVPGSKASAPGSKAPMRPLPVMVWLHGGGLTGGAGEDIVPDEFAERTGTVVVTVNYRLGALGFLATEGLDGETSDGVSGNFGMQDQQLALRWVQSNIGRFGGDPGRVTIAGESAGGGSVCNQLASPTAKGLYRAAIIQSGAYNDCAARTRTKAVDEGAAFAKKAGCPDPATAVACLRGKSAQEILTAQAGFSWAAVAGGRFLPRQPAEAFAAGAAAGIPVMNGANQDEGRLFAFAQFDGNGKPLTADQYPKALEQLFGPALAPEVERRYPLGDFRSPTIAFGTALGDQFMACTALRLDRTLARRGKVYAYEFADRTSPPFPSLRKLGTNFPFGATHVNEVQYLFKHFGITTPLDDQQRVLARQMVQYWGSFIHGSPPRAQGGPVMPHTEGRVLSLRTASAGGLQVSTTVDEEHLCDLWDAAATA
ncbi:carboxylesterase family protein [Streptomyces sp. TRM66268-LWL]|uniref:Carboxylic ester hydrolase n=1 Tax=Streptomyces polyasparticus TaxID=2767826 RepID=A0ABR7STD5_9ACTN|nr:carboxylesterase family protein [Streptomyces polyasparticus]MBC9718741.1 carboxylesterase family protein [Streptomyces polyasparticus]